MKACIAYAHITIPTLEDTDQQCKLYLLTAQSAMLNGLIGEADSLLKAILETLDESFTKQVKEMTNLGQKLESQHPDKLYKIGELLQSVLGFLVVVPSNPEYAFFVIVEGILNFLRKEEWGNSEHAYRVQIRVLDSCVRYLATQTQDTLPYRIDNVESNDQIFIGSTEFAGECEQLMDHCFEQILETIQKLDAVKDQYYPVLFDTCMDAANILIGNCAVNTKPINGFVNKLFKMSDKYMNEHNKVPG